MHTTQVIVGYIILALGSLLFSITLCATFKWCRTLVQWIWDRCETVIEFIYAHFWKMFGFIASSAMIYGALKLLHFI